MSVLLWIILTCLLGAALSIAIASGIAWRIPPAKVSTLVSYAVGALLGAVFLELLPHAFAQAAEPEDLGIAVLLGLLLFFVLEKLVIWRHHHDHHWGASATHAHTLGEHGHAHSGMMIMLGDTVHNFVDGILIATTFLADVQLGVVTALAIIAHEIPQEAGDFLVLLHSGYSRGRAIAINALSSSATLIGGLAGYFALNALHSWIPSLLGFAAASMIYVAVADLIPGLHRRPELRATAQQVVLIGLGIASIYLVRVLTGHDH